MKKCILVSRFGAINIGDLVISNILYEKVSDYFDVDRYDYFTDSFKIRDINNVVNSQQVLRRKILSWLSSSVLKKLLIKLRKVKRSTQKPNTLFDDAVGQYDLVIIGGGNMLMSLTSENKSSINLFKRFVNTAKAHNKPIYIMDIGIGPFANKEHAKEAVSVLNKCDYITFRDEGSYKIYIDNGGIKEKAKVSIDPAFHLEKESQQKEPKAYNCVAVNIMNSKHFGYDEEEYKRSIYDYVNLIDKLTNEVGLNVIIFVTTYEDQQALNDVYRLTNNKQKLKKVDVNGLKDLLNIYNEVDLLIGTRMHSMIIAYTQKVPLIGLSWQGKVNSLFEIIDEQDYLYKFEDLGMEIEQIVDSCKIRLKNIETYKKDIDSKLLEIRSKAKGDKEILEKLA